MAWSWPFTIAFGDTILAPDLFPWPGRAFREPVSPLGMVTKDTCKVIFMAHRTFLAIGTPPLCLDRRRLSVSRHGERHLSIDRAG